ncbi:MAG: hypothetical protein Kow0037_15320 [Calditrichia bacterium]
MRICRLVLNSGLYICLFWLSFIYSMNAFAQTAPSPSSFEELPPYLFNGVIQSRYKQPGWNEFVMPLRIEFDSRSPRSINHHPRLLPNYLFQEARQRINQPEFAVYYQMLNRLAGSSSGFTRVTQLAAAAKANAFFYLLKNDPRYLEKSIRILNQLPEPPVVVDWEGGVADRDWGDYLQSAEPIFDLCVTYDWLYADLPLRTREELERKVLQVTEQLITALPVTPKNNHVTVMAAAVLVAGLTFDTPEKHIHYNAGSLYRKGWEFLSQSLGLIAPDGGYAEGPYYARYILKYLAPLAFYLQNSVGSRMFHNPRLQRLVLWTLDNDKGSGQFSAFDDSYPTQHLFLPLLRGEMDLPVTTDFYPAESQQKVTPSAFAAEVLLYPAYFSRTRSGRIGHQYKGIFYADMGQAIFRNRFPGPDFFATLLFEDPQYFADAHEHMDPLSLEISAFGQDFIIDNGYGTGTGDANRPWFISPEANSAPVVDGYGWNPNPLTGDPPYAELHFGFSTPSFAAVSAGGWNGEVEINRSLFYPGNQTLIVLDRFSGRHFHRFGSRWHSPLQPEIFGSSEVRWTGNGAILQGLFIGSPQSRQPITLHSLQTAQGNTPGAYQLLLETPPARESFTVSIFRAAAATAPVFNRRPLLQGTGEWVMLDSRNAIAEEIAVAHTEQIATDRWQAASRLIYLASHQNDWQKLLLVDGTRFSFAGFFLESNYPITIYLEKDDSGISGYLHFDERIKDLRIRLKAAPFANWKVNGTPQPTGFSGGQIILRITGPGKIEAGFPLHPMEIARKTPPDTLPPDLNPTLLQKGFLSDYQRMELYNFTTRAMLHAAERTAADWSSRGTGEPQLLKNTLNVVQGLLAYGYRSAEDGKGFRLPHLYRGSRTMGGYSLSWREEGDWRKSGMDVRYLDMNLEDPNGRGIRLNFANPYRENRQSHLQFSLSRRQSLHAGQSIQNGSRLRYLGLHWFYEDWGIAPLFTFRDGELQTANFALNIPRAGLYGQYGKNDRGKFYLGWVKVRWHQQQHLRIETQRYSSTGRDSLDIRFDAGGKLGKNWYYLSENRFTRQARWHWQEAFAALQGQLGRSWYFYHNLSRLTGAPAASEVVLHHTRESSTWQFRGNMRLEAPITGQYASASRSGRLTGKVFGFTEAEWQRLSVKPISEFGFRQSFTLPAGTAWQHHTSAQIRWNKYQTRFFLGQGVDYAGPAPFSVSLYMALPESEAWGLRGSSVLPLGKNERLQIIGEGYFEHSKLLWCLVELNQFKPIGLIPGLRFKFREPDIFWVNGRLSWRW